MMLTKLVVWRISWSFLLLASVQFTSTKIYEIIQFRRSIPLGVRREKPFRPDPELRKHASKATDFENDTKLMKEITKEYTSVFEAEHVIQLEDLKDLDLTTPMSPSSLSLQSRSKSRVIDLLRKANLQVSPQVLAHLPTDKSIASLYGDQRLILGQESCAAFRDSIPPSSRYVGVVGQMNSGTNALARYLTQNIRMPQNPNGVLWTVPWYKHSWASLRNRYFHALPDQHENVMPVVIIRDPYFWMQSMCTSPYTLEWDKLPDHCPTLRNDGHDVPVKIHWGQHVRQWDNLLEMWNTWYEEYVNADMPRLIVRFEDLLLDPQGVVETIRECVGAEWKQDEFVYTKMPAKTHPYFSRYKPPSSMVSALIKYMSDGDFSKRIGTMNAEDLRVARDTVSERLLSLFHYQHLGG